MAPYHMHRKRNICGKPENRAKRSVERTSSIWVSGHCNKDNHFRSACDAHKHQIVHDKRDVNLPKMFLKSLSPH